jgi:hypothetical protein
MDGVQLITDRRALKMLDNMQTYLDAIKFVGNDHDLVNILYVFFQQEYDQLIPYL